jgi:hypothetical protein
MEFSYRISEAEYLKVAKVKIKGSPGLSEVFLSLFICALLVVAYLEFHPYAESHEHRAYTQPPSIAQQPTPDSTIPGRLEFRVFHNAFPFIAITGCWILGTFVFLPMHTRRLYKKVPALQGQFTVDVTQESISMQNTSGVSSKAQWNTFDHWREVKGVIMLVAQSGGCFLISLSRLTSGEQDELRGILTASLRKM